MMYIEKLKQDGDFLSLTRANEWHLEPAQFTLDNGTQVAVHDTGVIEFTPAGETSKDIVLSSAVHGNETAPIEICDALIRNIIKGKLTLKQHVLFIFGNPASINIGERFVEENLNRLFNGTHEKNGGHINKERVRAAKLEGYVRDFFESQTPGRYRCHYDLHTAIRDSKNEKFAVYPFLHGKAWKKEQLQFLSQCGVNTVLMMQSPATTFSYFSSEQFEADAFTVELGKVRPFGHNDMTRFEAVNSTLTELITQSDIDLSGFDVNNFELFTVHRSINRECENFSFSFADDVPNFTGFKQGELLAIDGETAYYAEVDGEAIIFPNARVALGQRALLTVIPLDVTGKLI